MKDVIIVKEAAGGLKCYSTLTKAIKRTKLTQKPQTIRTWFWKHPNGAYKTGGIELLRLEIMR